MKTTRQYDQRLTGHCTGTEAVATKITGTEAVATKITGTEAVATVR